MEKQLKLWLAQNHTVIRQAILSKDRLAVTLRFLATGSVADRVKRHFYDDTDRMIWVQLTPWLRCCVLG